jgi:hypothetical protein
MTSRSNKVLLVLIGVGVVCFGRSEAEAEPKPLAFHYLRIPRCNIKRIQPDGVLELSLIGDAQSNPDPLKSGRFGGYINLTHQFERESPLWQAQFFAIDVISVDDLGNVVAKVGPEAAQKIKARIGNEIHHICFYRPADATEEQMRLLPDYVELREPDLPLPERLGELQQLDRKDLENLRLAASKLGKIARMLVTFRELYRVAPPAFKLGPDYKPRHSWRLLVLRASSDPEAFKIFQKYRQDEPWDSAHNVSLIQEMPDIFRDPSFPNLAPGQTTFVALTGERTAFALRKIDRDNGTQQVVTAESPLITDRASDTILVGQIDPARAVPWTKPDDLIVDEKFSGLGHAAGLATPYQLGNVRVGLAAFADGQIRALRTDDTKENLLAMLTANGRERVTPPFAIDLPYRLRYAQLYVQLYPVVRVSFLGETPSAILSYENPPPYDPTKAAAIAGRTSSKKASSGEEKKQTQVTELKSGSKDKRHSTAGNPTKLKFRAIVESDNVEFGSKKKEGLHPQLAIINKQGQVAFSGFSSSGPRTTDRHNVWVWQDGEMKLASREPRIAPMDTGGRDLPFAMNDNGELAIVSHPSSKPNHELIWFGKPGSMQPVIRMGDVAPDSDESTFFSATYNRLPSIRLNNAGVLAFSAQLLPPPGSPVREGIHGVWVGPVSKLRCAGRTGGPSPQKSTTWTFGPSLRGLSENGSLVLTGSAGGKTTSFGGQIWVGEADKLTSLTSNEGELNSQKPHLTAGSNSQAAPRMNRGGAFVFGAVASPNATSHCGLWTGRDLESCTEVVSSFVRPNGATSKFLSFLQAEINDSGAIAFLAQIDDRPFPDNGRAGSHALFVLDGRTPRRLIDDAGVAALVQKKLPETIKVKGASINQGFAWNAKNEAVLFATIQFERQDRRSFDDALLAIDSQGEAHLVACPHLPLEVVPGKSTNVASVEMICNSPGGANGAGLNDNGQFVFLTRFEKNPAVLVLAEFAR